MIGLLLEGFIKTQSTLELITPPTALFPTSSPDKSFRVSEIAAGILNIHLFLYIKTQVVVLCLVCTGLRLRLRPRLMLTGQNCNSLPRPKKGGTGTHSRSVTCVKRRKCPPRPQLSEIALKSLSRLRS